ncbi:MAG: hypothetical protein AAF602_03930 [Myxococcota bacterium]
MVTTPDDGMMAAGGSAMLLALLVVGCAERAETPIPSTLPDGPVLPPTAEQLEAFYAPHGGRDAFPDVYVDLVETLLYAEDDITAGDLGGARARIDVQLAKTPWDAAAWTQDVTLHGLNVGSPVAYYGLRMLDVVASEPLATVQGTLQLTAVVATCADVRRPTLEGGAETVRLEVDPGILADDHAMLQQVTAVFRRWVQTITGGLEVQLAVHALSACATVDFTDDGSIVRSYPDADDMIDRVPRAIADATDFWWVIAPSGVPGDGSGFERHFITGGMGVYGAARPLFLSDDAWFTRKPEHLGTGPYSDVERRVYQPQWFQHEFMHHLFRTWPELQLEVTSHQWFDRATWPDDFEGRFEPDYYAEAIAKRFGDVTPPLAEGLPAPEPVVIDDVDVLVGDYARLPVENGYHEVTVTTAGGLRWTNAASVSWSLEVRDGRLFAGPDCPYGEQAVPVTLGEDGRASALFFNGEDYVRR